MTEEEFQRRVNRLKKWIDIQSAEGENNTRPYILGLINGIIFAYSIITEEDPAFLLAKYSKE